MTQNNHIIQAESELIARLNQERELFIGRVADCSKIGAVERDGHVSLMQSAIEAIDRILNDAGYHAESMASLREVRDNATQLLAQLDHEAMFEDTFEADADPI